MVVPKPAVEAWAATDTPAAEETPDNSTTTGAQPAPEAEAPSHDDALPEDTELVEAETGVGARGRNYGGGIITEPVRQYFRIEQYVAFRINIPHAIPIFHALHDRYPNSHEEFMREIIEANGIQLPELPAGQYYLYDPEAIDEDTEKPGVLMVARPRP